MRQAVAVVSGLLVVVMVGCKDYDLRLQETLDEMKYQKQLNDNLAPPQQKGRLKDELIYIRPPKSLTGPTQTFGLAIEPGKFDVEDTFIDQAKSASLHVLARHKKPTPASKKKTTAPPAEATPRGKFTPDVLEVVKNAYGVDVPANQLKPDSKSHKGRDNPYKAAKLDLATKEVQVFIYGNDNDTYQVALIFEGPKEELRNLSSKINYCLQCFGVGDAARRSFAGVTEFDEGDAGGAPPPI